MAQSKKNDNKIGVMKKITNKIARDNERGARRALIEDLFYDFHRSRRQVYLMNFYRGISFGFGAMLGGTVLVAVIVWLLNQTTAFTPDFIGDFINQIIDAMDRKR